MHHISASDGVDLVCHEAGRSDGRAAMLLHGLTGTAGIWAQAASGLAPRFRVFMPDLRGHGASGRTDVPEEYTLERLASDVGDVLDGLGIDRTVLVGHGLGGSVAQLFTLDQPGRVDALVLVGTGPGPLDASSGWARIRAELAQVAGERGMEAAWDHYVESGLIGWELDDVPSEITQRWRTQFMQTSGAALVGLVAASAGQQDRTARLTELEVPVLVVVGDDDQGFADAAHRLVEAMPSAELAVLADGGHSPQVTRPDAFNELVFGFLRRVLPKGRG